MQQMVSTLEADRVTSSFAPLTASAVAAPEVAAVVPGAASLLGVVVIGLTLNYGKKTNVSESKTFITNKIDRVRLKPFPWVS